MHTVATVQKKDLKKTVFFYFLKRFVHMLRPCDFRWSLIMIFWYKWPRIFCAYLRGMYDLSSRSLINSLQGGRFVLTFIDS
jgi:hypothetical protein